MIRGGVRNTHFRFLKVLNQHLVGHLTAYATSGLDGCDWRFVAWYHLNVLGRA